MKTPSIEATAPIVKTGVHCDMGVSEKLASEVRGDSVEDELALDRQRQGLPDAQVFFDFIRKSSLKDGVDWMAFRLCRISLY